MNVKGTTLIYATSPTLSLLAAGVLIAPVFADDVTPGYNTKVPESIVK